MAIRTQYLLRQAHGWAPPLLGRTATRRLLSSVSTVPASTATSGNITFVAQGPDYFVVDKPPSVVCHHSEWTGSRQKLEIPMLQRVREAFGGRRINWVHRLDRGCSGCLLGTYQEDDTDDDDNDCGTDNSKSSSSGATALWSRAMSDPSSNKTYIALVRGEGILSGVDLKERGWFLVDRAIKDESGKLNNASTWFRFVAGQPEGDHRPRASLVLARPLTGRWHQIRRHLNGLSHPILGDSSHGNSRVNREWRSQRGLLPERTCLHLASLDIVSDQERYIRARADLSPDMMRLLQEYMPQVLEEALPILQEEGIQLINTDRPTTVMPYEIEAPQGSSTW